MSQRAEQTNANFFKFRFRIFDRKQNFFRMNRVVNIDLIALCYMSMDLCEQALQTNEKLFSHFKLVFKILAENQKIFKRIARREY